MVKRTLAKDEENDTAVPHSALDSTSLDDRVNEVEQLYSLKVGTDFTAFFSFCSQLCSADPLNALLPLGLKLVGPFEVLAGQSVAEPHTAHRLFYDVPEFVTVAVSTDSDLHYGLYRDTPDEITTLVLSNNPSVSSTFSFAGANLFSAISSLQKHNKSSSSSSSSKKQKTMKKIKKEDDEKITNIFGDLEEYCKTHAIEFSREFSATKWKARTKACVAKDAAGIGVSVPHNKSTGVGFRELPYTLKQLHQLVTAEKPKQDDIYDLINYVNIANDEGDFGSALQLGRSFFCADTPEKQRYAKVIQRCLCTVYDLLDRPFFSEVLKAHLNNQRNVCKHKTDDS
eukprot:GHVS01051942.1.p1 GENE.GHVS01051942.1~~GHVS01051942.1.p1  ORF type:complete len:341 (-),score=55.24 GHVS01051942.1:114-1136(-)